MDKKRADQLLVEKKAAVSRTFAQDLINEGRVFYLKAGIKIQVTKAGQALPGDTVFYIESEGTAGKFVSRAGSKLEGALKHSGINVKGFTVLDVGLSTGGFSDCLLQHGASSVFGIEVGHNQTHPKIACDKRVRIFEKVNARLLRNNTEVTKEFPPKGFDLIVMDVSFISMTLIVPEVLPYLGQKGSFLALVKPQFEVGPQKIGKGGIVKDPNLYTEVENKIRLALEKEKMKVTDYFPSEVEGKDGNQEYFVLATRL